MSVTNLSSLKLLSNKTLARTYRYAGVVDVIGYRGPGAYIDGHTNAYNPTCTYLYATQNCTCCGDSGPPDYICNTCDYYSLQYYNYYPSSSFNTGSNMGYYDPGTLMGFKSFASATAYYAGHMASFAENTCVDCTGKTEAQIIAASGSNNDYFGRGSYAGIKEKDGSLWTWGYNEYGQLGNGTTVPRQSPVQVGTHSWKMVAACYAEYVFAAIRSDDTLWTWGSNFFGTCGDGTSTSRSSPVQVPGSWKMVRGSHWTFLAIKSDDTLWGWGYNGNGQLGDNSLTTKSSPVQVSGGGTWKFAHPTYYNGFGIKTDGTLYSWGLGGYYGLGDGTSTTKSSPVQIGAAYSDWSQITDVNYAMYAIRDNGTLWTWGQYTYGLTSSVQYTSLPIQTSGKATNHKKVCDASVYGLISGIDEAGFDFRGPAFITTEGNLIGYSGPFYGTSLDQLILYSGGDATSFTCDANLGQATFPSVFLTKYVK